MRVDDACVVKKDKKYWLYYTGRQLNKSPNETKMGLAISRFPEGPYKKYNGTRKPRMIVTHWDAATSAASCKKILEKRIRS